MKVKTSREDDPEQSKRFIEAARGLQADESDEGADRAFREVTKTPTKRRKT